MTALPTSLRCVHPQPATGSRVLHCRVAADMLRWCSASWAVQAPAACCTVRCGLALLPAPSCRQGSCLTACLCCLQETAQADAIAGRPIVMAIALASVTGLAYLLGLTYCIDVSHGVLLSCTCYCSFPELPAAHLAGL